MAHVTKEMSPQEYQEYVLSKPTKSIGAHARCKQYSLPYPYNKRTPVLEKELLKQVKFVLANHGYWHMRIEANGKIVGDKLIPSQMVGLSDIIAIDECGTFCAIEIKKPGGRVSAVQINTLQDIIRAGGRACICVDPAALAEFMAFGTAKYQLEGVPVI